VRRGLHQILVWLEEDLNTFWEASGVLLDGEEDACTKVEEGIRRERWRQPCHLFGPKKSILLSQWWSECCTVDTIVVGCCWLRTHWHPYCPAPATTVVVHEMTCRGGACARCCHLGFHCVVDASSLSGTGTAAPSPSSVLKLMIHSSS
jgi:hypothetical protein